MLAVSGCARGDIQEPITLTVNFPSAKQFYQIYGHDFEDKYRNITIKVIEQDLSDGSIKPSSDVLYIDQLSLYNRLVEEGQLLNLEQRIRDENYPLTDLSPVVADSLRSEMDGQLYALSPSFISYALYYNKDLFTQYGIPFPQNRMSWEEVLELARRFPKQNKDGEPLYGFKTNYYMNIPFSLILRIGQTEGLTFIDPRTLQVNMHSQEWKTIIHTVVDAFRDGAIYDKSEDPTGEIEPAPILTGNAAMEIQSYATAYNFDSYSKFVGGQSIDWDLVTVPVASRIRDQSDYYEVSEIFGISAKTEHEAEAWKLIEYMTSDTQKMEVNLQNQVFSGLPAKTDLIPNIDGHDLSPLYVLQPILKSNNPYDYVDYQIINVFKDIGQSVVQEVIEDKISIDEAISKIENEGQQAINEIP